MPGVAGSKSSTCSQVVALRAQRSFAPEALPSFFALTTSCASPKASHQLRFVNSLVSLYSLDHPLLVFRTFPTLLLRFLPWMLGPLLRQPLGCTYPFLPPEHRPSPKRQMGRRSAKTRATTSARTVFRICSHSFMFRPPALLATQVVPTDVTLFVTWQPWRLLPSTVCVVASSHVGYASRPIPGN